MINDDEMENYQAKYGSIEQNDKYFDDHPNLGNNYLQYKISKIKFWKNKKGNNIIITGIQTTYKNIGSDEEIISEEYRGINNDNNSETVEFNLEPREYIINVRLSFSESSIFRIVFKTNLKNEFSVGDKKDDEFDVIELNNDKKKFVLSFFGTYGNNNLTSIGFFINKSEEFFEYFIKGYFQLKLFLSNKDNLSIIEKKIENNEYDYENKALIRACKLPKILFHQIIKYTSPI
jgi:hypothetical protein